MKLIFIFESTAKAKTDYKYIKSLLDYYYKPRSFSYDKIFAETKSQLIKKDSQIKSKLKGFNDRAEVIICADYDSKDDSTNEKITSYVKNNGYHVIWMNRDIEEVFWGYRVDRKDKTKKADEFLKKWNVMIPKLDNLMESNPIEKISSSNSLIVIKEILGEFTNNK